MVLKEIIIDHSLIINLKVVNRLVANKKWSNIAKMLERTKISQVQLVFPRVPTQRQEIDQRNKRAVAIWEIILEIHRKF